MKLKLPFSKTKKQDNSNFDKLIAIANDCSYPCEDPCTKLSFAKQCHNYRPYGERIIHSFVTKVVLR